jgi:hypothetical protein
MTAGSSATLGTTLTNSAGSTDLAVELPTERGGVYDEQGDTADLDLFTDPSEIATLWPSGKVPGDKGGFANPAALLEIDENGDTNLTSNAQNSMHAVSAQGSGHCVLMRRLHDPAETH